MRTSREVIGSLIEAGALDGSERVCVGHGGHFRWGTLWAERIGKTKAVCVRVECCETGRVFPSCASWMNATLNSLRIKAGDQPRLCYNALVNVFVESPRFGPRLRSVLEVYTGKPVFRGESHKLFYGKDLRPRHTREASYSSLEVLLEAAEHVLVE